MDLKRLWFLFAFLGSLTYGLEAVLMQFVSPKIHKDHKLILLWIACFCVVLGVVAVPLLTYSYKTNKKLREKMKKNFQCRNFENLSTSKFRIFFNVEISKIFQR